MKIAELMKSPCITCAAQDTLDTAASKMAEYDTSMLPVVRDDGRLVGVVTDREICMTAWSRGEPLANLFVVDAMSKQLFSVRPDQDIGAAARLMGKLHVRRVPVIDGSDKPIGVITLQDLARVSGQPRTKIAQRVRRAIQTLSAHG